MEHLPDSGQCAVEELSRPSEAQGGGNGSCTHKGSTAGDSSTEQSPLGKRKRPQEEEDDDGSPSKKVVGAGFLY